MIYLDTASTAGDGVVHRIIIDDMANAMREYWMNPSSLYASKVKNKINECKKYIADYINAEPEEIIYTSGGSESNNLAIQGFFKQCKINKDRPFIITTKIEHKSILECLKNINVLEAERYYVTVNENGCVDYDGLKNILEYRKYDLIHGDYKLLVSIQYANNEIGTIQDIEKIAKLVHEYKGVFHTDAVQIFGKRHIDVKASGIDMMSVAGHKLAPALKGIGFLYKKNDVKIQPIIYGSQENGLRAGTENVAGIIGLNTAVEYCRSRYNNNLFVTLDKRERYNYITDKLKSKFNCKVNGSSENRLYNNISVTFPQNITSEALLYTLEMSDIYVSAGSACNAKEIKPSHVLKAIGLSDEEAMKTIRITFTDSVHDIISYDEIDKFIDELEKAIELIESESE